MKRRLKLLKKLSKIGLLRGRFDKIGYLALKIIRMKVILLKNIENFGEKYDVKEVKSGYAKNFLLPKKMVKIATNKNLQWLEQEKEKIETEVKKSLDSAQKLAAKIDGSEVIVAVKVGDKGTLFEKIGAQKIVESLTNIGFKIKKSQIVLPDLIKAIGEYSVKVSFEHNLEAEIKVIVEAAAEK